MLHYACLHVRIVILNVHVDVLLKAVQCHGPASQSHQHGSPEILLQAVDAAAQLTVT